MEKLYRMSEAAQILGVTVRTLQRWDKAGKARFIRTPKGKRRLAEGDHHVNLHILDEQLHEKSVQEELVEDLMAIIASFSGKLYGIRSHKNKILEAKVKGVLEDVTNLPDETKEHPAE